MGETDHLDKATVMKILNLEFVELATLLPPEVPDLDKPKRKYFELDDSNKEYNDKRKNLFLFYHPPDSSKKARNWPEYQKIKCLHMALWHYLDMEIPWKE